MTNHLQYTLASFPCRLQDKWPVNFCKFKLLLLLLESWQLRSNFRTSSHNSNKSSCIMYSSSTVTHFCLFQLHSRLLNHTGVGVLYNGILFEQRLPEFCCWTCSKKLQEYKAPFLVAGNIISHTLLQYSQLEWAIAIAMTLHYSLNSLKLPGHFSYGLGPRLEYRQE